MAMILNSVKEFGLGLAAPFRGTWVFLRHPRWWLLGLPALVLTLLLAAGVGWGTQALLSAWVHPAEGSFLAWAVALASLTVTLGMLCLLPAVYALFGELFFDALTSRSRMLLFGLPDAMTGFWTSVARSLPAVRYVSVTVTVYAVLYIPALFVPFGLTVLEVFFAYRMGVAYVLNCAAVGGETTAETLAWVQTHRARVLGFGLGIRLLMVLPVLNIPGLPGVLVGAVIAKGPERSVPEVPRRERHLNG